MKVSAKIFQRMWRALDSESFNSYLLEYGDDPDVLIYVLHEEDETLFNRIVAALEEREVKPMGWAQREFIAQRQLKVNTARGDAMAAYKQNKVKQEEE